MDNQDKGFAVTRKIVIELNNYFGSENEVEAHTESLLESIRAAIEESMTLNAYLSAYSALCEDTVSTESTLLDFFKKIAPEHAELLINHYNKIS